MTDVTIADTEAPVEVPEVPVAAPAAPLAVPEAPGRISALAGSLPIEALQDVEMKVEVVLGRARLRLQELLDIRTGQVIELDRTRNSPVEVLVNGTLFARGEIVVIDETHLGVRIGEVVTVENARESR
jgi:flagellar motor switch protein FliN/FliY